MEASRLEPRRCSPGVYLPERAGREAEAGEATQAFYS